METKDFYRAFEGKYRGSRELIKSRLEVYLPFILPLKDIYKECNMLDIGCGRGEWLELMTENDFNAIGVDLDDGMLEACKELKLNAIKKDALLALKELPNESQVVVSGFHLAEHLPFKILLQIVKEVKRVLKPAGVLILETPNPANIYVGTNSFYFDPTHISPIPSELLSFLPEFYGYTRIKVLGLQENKEIDEHTIISIYDVYKNSSQDYAVVAQNNANQELLSLFDSAFAKEYGLSTELLCSKFDKKTEHRFRSVETMAQNAETALNAIYDSRSWKITAPLRAFGDFIKKLKNNG